MALPWDKAILSGEMVLKTRILLHSVAALFFFFWQYTDFGKWVEENCAAELTQPNHVICLPEYDNFSPYFTPSSAWFERHLHKFQVFQTCILFLPEGIGIWKRNPWSESNNTENTSWHIFRLSGIKWRLMSYGEVIAQNSVKIEAK